MKSYRTLVLDSVGPKRMEIWRMLASGKLHKEVAAELGITKHMADRHVEILHGKLGTHNVADLTREAVRFGVIEVKIEK